MEGRLLFRRHRVRERDRGLVRRKKATAATLACEVCGFDFGAFYGRAGDGFIECHHVIPLGQGGGTRQTRLADLALVCANCHRVLHRGDPPPSVEGLKGSIPSVTEYVNATRP
jgi:5-methylcytosine-specific restriction protein A